MKLGIVKESGVEYPIIFLQMLEDIPGGITIFTDDLKTATKELKAGAMVGEDGSTAGLYHLCKTAEVYEAAALGATEVKVEKEHEFKIGDFITNGNVSTAITGIDSTTSTLYDALTLTATLDAVEAIPVDSVLYQGSSETSNAAVASVAILEDEAEDYLTISNPRGVSNDILVQISQAAGDALALTYTPSTKTLLIALANLTASKNNAATVQTALRALVQSAGVDFTDWTAVGTGWDGGQTGATLTDAKHRMEDGVPKPDFMAPKYTPCALTNAGLDVSEDDVNSCVGAVVRGTVNESLLPFVVHSSFKTLLTENIRFD